MTTEMQFLLFLPIIVIAIYIGEILSSKLIKAFDNLPFVKKHLRTEEEKIMEELRV